MHPYTGRFRFGAFELDFDAAKLTRNGRIVKIQPQPFRVLEILVERAGEIVSREDLRTRIWGESTFVEFDQGLNYCARQIRLALRDRAAAPAYIETLPKQGYRFIAQVVPELCEIEVRETERAADTGNRMPELQAVTEAATDSPRRTQPSELPLSPRTQTGKRFIWYAVAGLGAIIAILSAALYPSSREHIAGLKYTQLTDFTDSALAPALSPDGRRVAFIRGSQPFLTADQIYVKELPDGEPRQLTKDTRPKYSVAFSPDGSDIAYTILDPPWWKTYTVSVDGGEPHLFLNNAAGLTWLDKDQLLFSRVRSRMHMGIVTATALGDRFRELYFPAHERGMAHYSYPSPDRKSALVAEMDERAAWTSCRLIALDGDSPTKLVGPRGSCLYAAWSPDGAWMYFSVLTGSGNHLWRQRYPDGQPEQITFGPNEQSGVAMEPDGRSLITSMGVHESAIWLHDAHGEHSLSSEGEVVASSSPPSFGEDAAGQPDKLLYFLLRRASPASGSTGSGAELWRVNVESGKSEGLFPGTSIIDYDVSPDGRQVLYTTAVSGGKSHLWLASISPRSPPRQIGASGAAWPHFGPHGQILFQISEGNFNYLEQINPDGSGRSKVVPYPISTIQCISPGGHWVMAIVPLSNGTDVSPMAIPVEGGSPRVVCAHYCIPKWSSTGKYIFIPVENATRNSTGRSLAIPVGQGEKLPEFPPGGIKLGSDPSVMPGAQSVMRADLVPGEDLSRFAYVNTTVHRNLYRISLP